MTKTVSNMINQTTDHKIFPSYDPAFLQAQLLKDTSLRGFVEQYSTAWAFWSVAGPSLGLNLPALPDPHSHIFTPVYIPTPTLAPQVDVRAQAQDLHAQRGAVLWRARGDEDEAWQPAGPND